MVTRRRRSRQGGSPELRLEAKGGGECRDDRDQVVRGEGWLFGETRGYRGRLDQGPGGGESSLPLATRKYRRR